jgi:hypothetical protein
MMATFDLNVDLKLQRNLNKANAAFSKVDYPAAVAVVEVLVMHRIALLIEESSEAVKYGDATLRTIFLNPEDGEGDYVVLLNGLDIHGLAKRLWENGDWPGRRARLTEVHCIVKDVLSTHSLLIPLANIGIEITVSMGITLDQDVIMFESVG